MFVDIFGKTNVGLSQRVISGGVTLSQAINTFLRRDGKNAADENINMDSHNLINVLDPANAQDAATKHYVAIRAVSKSGDTMTGDLNMGGRMVKGLPIHYPTLYSGNEAPSWSQVNSLVNEATTNYKQYIDNQDAVTKYYADNLTKKSYSGNVSILEENISRTGFWATSSAVTTDKFRAYGAFNNLNDDGSNGSWATPSKKGWLQIKCPEPVIIWRVALKARAIDGKNISECSISGSIDGKTFTALLTSSTKLLGSANEPLFFNISTTTAYQHYRLDIKASTGAGDLGVQVMQLSTLKNGINLG
ncbi:hypothetical protein DPMN_153396 [Dreissena polymorpha]|uniref:F5/8 type C domain-containing protein n=1 Tax=Dreissena polymorpha TaxID=45954 RepID=A0A9D4FJA2_DREPO|nr:hypothetical protein DPMN_153396 [Dreissena polymorpha]